MITLVRGFLCVAILLFDVALVRSVAADPLRDATAEATANLESAKNELAAAKAQVATAEKEEQREYGELRVACQKRAGKQCPLPAEPAEPESEQLAQLLAKGVQLLPALGVSDAQELRQRYEEIKTNCDQAFGEQCPLDGYGSLAHKGAAVLIPDLEGQLRSQLSALDGTVNDLDAKYKQLVDACTKVRAECPLKDVSVNDVVWQYVSPHKVDLVAVLRGQYDALKNARSALDKAKQNEVEKARKVKEAQRTYNIAAAREELASESLSNSTFVSRMTAARHARCALALCWGGNDGTEYALELLADVPLGYFFGLGSSGVADYISANGFSASIAAGVRWWFAYDVVSLGLVFVNVDLSKARDIHIPSSSATFSPGDLHMTYPGLQLGIGGDVLALTVNIVELRNPDDASRADPKFGPNDVVSRGVSVGIAISPLALGRTLAAQPKKEQKP
jgi:hypothetical protein